MMQKIKDAIVNRIVDLLNNPHTSISGIGYLAFKVAGVIWPQKKAVLDEVAALAIAYGLLRAGDSSPRDTGTQFLNKIIPPKP